MTTIINLSDITPPPIVEKKEEEKQYCDNDCGTLITEASNTPIMCWTKKSNEATYCATCYWDCKYYMDDDNLDNADEIAEYYEQEEDLECNSCEAICGWDDFNECEECCKIICDSCRHSCYSICYHCKAKGMLEEEVECECCEE
tara:strand:+ start:507 stop:938 length:432 start_codon:yes stop_codon:yes gene_type:complete